jgi:hypothetical protein
VPLAVESVQRFWQWLRERCGLRVTVSLPRQPIVATTRASRGIGATDSACFRITIPFD